MFDMSYEKLFQASMMMDPTVFGNQLDQWMAQQLQAQQQGLLAGSPTPVGESRPTDPAPPAEQSAAGGLSNQSARTMLASRPQPVQPHFAPPVAPSRGGQGVQVSPVANLQIAPGGQAGRRMSMFDLINGRR